MKRRVDLGRQRSWLCVVGRLAVGGILVMWCTATGCGKQGSNRFDYSGKVTFRGQPVPKGYMLFSPDRDQGNSGPGSKAGIFDGRYETMKGQGVIGGPHVVTIVGTDGVPVDRGEGVMNPMGLPLFPEYTTKVDLPKESGTLDFEVPADKAK